MEEMSTLYISNFEDGDYLCQIDDGPMVWKRADEVEQYANDNNCDTIHNLDTGEVDQ